MADEHGAVIIRDDTGTEHEFPAGFDPKRAADIVRQRAAPSAAMPRDARGMPAVSSNLREGPDSPLLQQLGPLAHPETLVDFARLLTLPVDAVKRAYAGALTMASARPAAGAALSATGRGVEHVGTAITPASSTLSAVDLMTSHQPLRAGAIAVAPSVLKATGRGLQRAGSAVTGSGAPIAADVAAVAPVVAPPPIAVRPPVANPMAAAPVPNAPPGTLPFTPRAASSALPDQKALNEAALAVRRAAYQATQQGTAPATVEKIVAASGKMQLTAPEMKEFTRLLQRKMPLEDALKAVKAMRELAGSFGTPTAAEATAAIAARGYKG